MDLSTIIPIYNEEANTEALYARLSGVVAGMNLAGGYKFVFVNDGSRDNSLPLLCTLAAFAERQVLAKLAANYQLAVAQITRWKLQLRQQAAQVSADALAADASAPDVEPLDAALRRAPAPYIFNSDQGSQFTSLAYEQALPAAASAAPARAGDNAFVERPRRTVKWKHIYLNPADDGQHLFHQLDAYFAYYNHRRLH